MYINLGRFLSSELLQLIFLCEYWRLFHTSSCGPLIILYLLYLVFTVLFQYSMSMALFQYVTCTEPSKVTLYGLSYWNKKKKGHFKIEEAIHSETRAFLSKKKNWQQKDLFIYAITVDFFMLDIHAVVIIFLRNYL